MKIPIGKIAAWLGRVIVAAVVSEAADRLSRPKPVDDRRNHGAYSEDADNDRLQRE